MSLLRTAQPRDPQSRRIAGPPPAPSADRGIFPEAAAGEPVGQALDALSHLLDRSGEGAFALVRLLGAGKLLLVQALDLLLCRAHALAQLRNFVGEHDRRRHREPGITDFAEGLAQLLNTQVELAREPHEIILLPVVAGHAVDAAIDGHADLGHGSLASGPRPRARCGSCRPPSPAAARPRGWRLPPPPRVVGLGPGPRAAGAEGLQLDFEGLPPPVALDAQMHRRLKRVDGRIQPALRALDRRFVVLLVHGPS